MARVAKTAVITIDHNTDCQTVSGSAFRTSVTAPEQDFKLLSGTPKTYVKTAESGARRAQVFCPECGTAIYTTSVGDGPKIFRIRVGSARQRHELVPKAQVWFRSSQPWLADIGSIPSAEKQG